MTFRIFAAAWVLGTIWALFAEPELGAGMAFFCFLVWLNRAQFSDRPPEGGSGRREGDQ